MKGIEEEWSLPWSAHHLLLLTATPHMGKDYPYYALWKLLEPEVLSTLRRLRIIRADRRQSHFIRRTKEEMVHLDGRPLYPKRISDTLGYDLTQGPVSEQTLYDETTDYLRLRLQQGEDAQSLGRPPGDERVSASPGQFHLRPAAVL